ncbi:serine/threonine phosphatase [Geitlerinema sp. PCC 9228]|uniref:serine/threonine phosphatase n=1 Tax=Geitlerinema sp. PCC 9228 TaxID=111611 RepID=UPI0008F999A2|nr:serine/threonine phosphatase [Geitlerinema sp. PCC 9228]
MLVCPTCSYRNSGDPRFCYQCGTPLSYKICSGCRTQVDFQQQNCPQCKAPVGTIRQGIIFHVAVFDTDTDMDSDRTAPMSEAIPQVGDRLDEEQERYRILTVSTPNNSHVEEVSCRVLDCDPFRVPYLEARTQVQEDTLPLQVPCNADPWQRLVQPYQILALQFHRTVPKLYDAWQEQEKIILLLEDRSQLPRLSELDEHQISPEQILQWLGEMTELWGALLSCRCRSSLLQLGNLRVDEHQELCLERLYLDPEAGPPTLVDLAGRWKQLFQTSPIAGWQPWMDLLEDMMAKTVGEVSQLRSRLQQLAYALDGFSATKATPTASPLPRPVVDLEETEPTVTFAAAEEEDDDDSSTMAFPKQLLAIEEAGCTEVGRQRRHNEDTFAIWTRRDRQMSPTEHSLSVRGLYVLCDGMGGHEGGEVASAMAVQTLREYFQKYWTQADLPDAKTISKGIYLANQAIFQENQKQSRGGTRRMGTTLVMALLQNTQVAIAHVGDSRLYTFDREKQLQQLTTDHEVGQRRIRRGVSPEVAYSSPDAYQLTQALGPYDTEFLAPSIQYLQLEKDTLLLLASDGLSDNQFVETQAMENLYAMLGGEANLTQQVRALVDKANHHNGHDNITAIAVRTKIGSPPTS